MNFEPYLPEKHLSIQEQERLKKVFITIPPSVEHLDEKQNEDDLESTLDSNKVAPILDSIQLCMKNPKNSSDYSNPFFCGLSIPNTNLILTAMTCNEEKMFTLDDHLVVKEELSLIEHIYKPELGISLSLLKKNNTTSLKHIPAINLPSKEVENYLATQTFSIGDKVHLYGVTILTKEMQDVLKIQKTVSNYVFSTYVGELEFYIEKSNTLLSAKEFKMDKPLAILTKPLDENNKPFIITNTKQELIGIHATTIDTLYRIEGEDYQYSLFYRVSDIQPILEDIAQKYKFPLEN